MDKAQVKILIMVLIGVLYFGQALYSYLKKQAVKNVGRQKSQPRMHLVATQPVAKPKPDNCDKKIVRQQPFLAGEIIGNKSIDNPIPTIDKINENSQASPPNSEIDDSTSPIMSQVVVGNMRQELRRAVIWSEILQRKY